MPVLVYLEKYELIDTWVPGSDKNINLKVNVYIYVYGIIGFVGLIAYGTWSVSPADNGITSKIIEMK